MHLKQVLLISFFHRKLFLQEDTRKALKFCPISNKPVHIRLYPIAAVVYLKSVCASGGWYICEHLCYMTENLFNKAKKSVNVLQSLCF